jgi:hypothetical protein
MLQYIPTIVTVAGLVALVIRNAMPLLTRLPERWQWLPPALLAVCGAIAARFTGIDSDAMFLQEVIETLGILVAAGVRGYHGVTVPKSPTADGGKVPPILGALLVLLAVSGCERQEPKTAADARKAFCTDAAVVAVDEGCRLAVTSAKEADRGAVLLACGTLIDVQAEVCGDAR